MLLSFKVANYRSLRDEQLLSILSSGDGSRPAIPDGIGQDGQVTPVAVLYGANASGTTTVIKALLYVRELVTQSADRRVAQPLPDNGFMLDKDSASRPTEYEVRFMPEVGGEYLYGFSICQGKVHEEHRDEGVHGQQRTRKRHMFVRAEAESDHPQIN
ncbi:hypothetical protein CRD60_08095 [Bifidobacterium aemilianum]|uniref:ATPase AAA-type core domain-containing protein n=1 Tax=Bifidobacterium aemilianum TaxID=2493120 RepID=A0A366K7V3_9BIFI|nr:ATP-binding protein [Bifidobacterium aemilianum]RBP97193.1 hypothetical protein CRD60_08095 [Bifidobacterium aemilianum]